MKDHMREAGDVCFSDVFKDGTGAVEYLRLALIAKALFLIIFFSERRSLKLRENK